MSLTLLDYHNQGKQIALRQENVFKSTCMHMSICFHDNQQIHFYYSLNVAKTITRKSTPIPRIFTRQTT